MFGIFEKMKRKIGKPDGKKTDDEVKLSDFLERYNGKPKGISIKNTFDGINHNRKKTKREYMALSDDEKRNLVVDEIFRYVEDEKINLDYAMIGTCGKRCVLDRGLLIETLMLYGYPTRFVLDFVNTLTAAGDSSNEVPLVFQSNYRQDIYTDIGQLKNSVVRKFGDVE